MPSTSSPALSQLTPKPGCSTVPETSQPSTKGGSPRNTPWARVFQSTGLTPAACTRTRTSVGPGSGRATSASSNTSVPPSSVWRTTRMTVMSLLSGWGSWTILGELRREVAGITPKVLTQNLRSLERDGLVSRKVYPTTPPTVEYALTPLGESISVHLVALNTWTTANFDAVRAAREAYDDRQSTAPQPV